jgi:SAM-dependent methyltransferase
MINKKRSTIIEFGDFQTPPKLAMEICRLLNTFIPTPSSIIEPTCGVGNILFAADSAFPQTEQIIGVDINPRHISEAKSRAEQEKKLLKIEFIEGDFYNTTWQQVLTTCKDPILVIGNPPWVTNSHLSKLGSNNLPKKNNGNGLSGFEAISGKSNFDISEWMLIRLLDWLNGRNAVLAMLCKTSVARKVITYAWRSEIQMASAMIYKIDAKESFGVSVDACLLTCVLVPSQHCTICNVFSDTRMQSPTNVIGYFDGHLVANAANYLRWKKLMGSEHYRWRSGVKHDCSSVMELRHMASGYVNGLGESVDIEDDYLFPFFKSSDIANNRLEEPFRHIIVTQKLVGENTAVIKHLAPKTWRYLERHAELLDNRRSSIYTGQPRFSIFGVGDYTFSPWKVAISGLYKKMHFCVLSSFAGKPSILDDTCAFLACDSEEEAQYICSILNSPIAHEFYEAFLFPDAKRPITIDLLRQLDLVALARELGSELRIQNYLEIRSRSGRYGASLPNAQVVLSL